GPLPLVRKLRTFPNRTGWGAVHPQSFKGIDMKFSNQGLAIGAVLAVGVSTGVGVAFADHFNINNYPKGWTFTVNEGTKQCYHGCSDQKVDCDAPGKHGSQTSG